MAKQSEKYIYEIFIESLEKAKQVSIKNEETIKVLEEKLKQFDQNISDKLKNTDLTIDNSKVEESIEKFERTLKTTNKGQNILFYAYLILLTSFIILAINVFFFSINAQKKETIKLDYAKELQKKGLLLSNQDAEFVEKLRFWISKNPKDSQKLFKKVNDTYEKEKKFTFSLFSRLIKNLRSKVS